MSISLPLPELELLFLLIAEEPSDEEVQELIGVGFDWRYFCWLVGKEKAGRAPYRRLRSLPAGLVPEEALAFLRRQALVTSFRMGRLEERLEETLAALLEAGIEVILLKGAGLASTVYPSFGDRLMSDLDLLVPAERGEEAWSVVQETGWRRDRTFGSDDFYAGHQHYPPLTDASGTGFFLELHTSLLPVGHPFHLPLDELWASAVPVRRFGEGTYVLEANAQVLHLCLHFAWSHTLAAGSWRTVRDLKFLTAGGRVDWDGFEGLAQRSRAGSCAYWTWRIARRLGGLDLPVDVLERLAPPGSELRLRWLERHYLSHLVPLPRGACPSDRVRQALWEAGIRPGWCGHGDRRPWDRDSVYLDGEPGEVGEGMGAPAGPGAGAQLRGQVLRYREWARYLGVVSGLSGRRWPWLRPAARRRATSSNRGRISSISNGVISPSR